MANTPHDPERTNNARIEELLHLDMENFYHDYEDPDEMIAMLAELQALLRHTRDRLKALQMGTDPGNFYALVINWDNPYKGTDVRGPFPSSLAAQAAWEFIKADYENTGELPEDVWFQVVRIAPGYRYAKEPAS